VPKHLHAEITERILIVKSCHETLYCCFLSTYHGFIYMTQGKSRSVNTLDLSFIFFKIRETRCSKTRRSWQRRARLALAKRTDLTPAEKHEICSVWSKMNVQQINSPAMSKLRGVDHAPRPDQTISARSCTRRSFNAPARHCSDDRTNPALENAPQHLAICTLQRVLLRPAKTLFQGYIARLSRRGSVAPVASNDNRLNRRHRRGRMPKPQNMPKTPLSTVNAWLHPQKIALSTAHEMSCKR
jgi:hypothetical protein